MKKNSGKKGSGKRWPKVLGTCVLVLLIALSGQMVYLGATNYFGPFKFISIDLLEKKYEDRQQGEIIFYGASNFRLWKTMEEDLAPYPVQNKGFGGATDPDLLKYADRLVYRSDPSVVFFQTGSNDWAAGMSMEKVCANRAAMYAEMRENLPDSVLVVMSGLPLPGRTQYWEQIKEGNEFLKNYCNEHENMVFIDATDIIMTPDGDFRPELFRNDQIHLNDAGQALWAELILSHMDEIYHH